MPIRKIFHTLKQPYPFYYQGKTLWSFLGIIFLMGLAFNYFFEPFGVNPKEQRMPYFWICAVHAINAAAAILLSVFLLFLMRRNNENWTVGREVIFLAFMLLVIGVSQFLGLS